LSKNTIPARPRESGDPVRAFKLGVAPPGFPLEFTPDPIGGGNERM